MAKITKLNNFGSTKGINLKLIPVLGLDNRKLMTSSTLWRHQVCNLQTRTYILYLFCKIHTWWRHNVDEVINHLLLTKRITGVSLEPIPLVDLEISAQSVKYRPVCTIHVEQDITMKLIPTFLFCQDLLLDKVSWLLNSTFCFAQLTPGF